MLEIHAPLENTAEKPDETHAAKKRTVRRSRRTTKSRKGVRSAKTSASRRASRIFALDIGTRSVIGIVAEQASEGMLRILATERLEHKTRAMLDGQIHDVPQVADIISQVRKALEKRPARSITPPSLRQDALSTR